jgi:hypothetical protein
MTSWDGRSTQAERRALESSNSIAIQTVSTRPAAFRAQPYPFGRKAPARRDRSYFDGETTTSAGSFTPPPCAK